MGDMHRKQKYSSAAYDCDCTLQKNENSDTRLRKICSGKEKLETLATLHGGVSLNAMFIIHIW
jgi:hypothetical protein